MATKATNTNDWKIRKNIYLPRDPSGNETHKFVSVNDYTMYVERGKEVSVPLPIYNVLKNWMENEENMARKLMEGQAR